MKTIGLVGAGLMGAGIAKNLLKHGHKLVILEHAGNQPLDQLRAEGAITVATGHALAAQSEAIILCVTGSPQVEQVLQSANGVLAGLRPGTLVIDCSTAVPSSTQKMAALVEAAGAHFADSPMTRTAKEAAEGRLNLLVGASPEVFAKCEPILRCFAENIIHAGPVGAGHQMKLLHNFVSLGCATLIAEAAACAKESGVDAQVFIDVLSKGGGAGIALERLKPFILNQDASGLRFTIANALKDLSYYNDMATEVKADNTVAAAVKATLSQASESVRNEPVDIFLPELVRLLGQRK